MANRIRRVILAGRRWVLLGGLLFPRFHTVSAARASLAELARGNHPEPDGPRQLLADVSIIARKDAGTGIQRVVRELLRQLLVNPPPGFEVRPVKAGFRRGFHYAEQYRASLIGKDSVAGPTGPVQVRAGDIFLGLDLAARFLSRHHFQLSRWKASGVKFFFIVYDLLPVLHPEWFSPGSVKAYRHWIRTVATIADGAVCISQSVADELKQWLADTFGRSVSQAIPAMWFQLGSDIPSCPSVHDHSSTPGDLLEQISKRPTILMVGTVEPRKGYAQALSAFEKLWHQGRDVNLVIVGRTGWRVEGLVQRLRDHPAAGSRLIWLEDVTDEMLRVLYGAATGVLMASEGEGFGLPIVEAALHGKSILARDIKVFREVAGDHAHYFSGTSAEDLSTELGSWLDLIQKDQAPRSTGINRQSWQESARQFTLRVIDLDQAGAKN